MPDKPTSQITLSFDKNEHPLGMVVREELSCCVRIEKDLFLAFDEGSSIERLSKTAKGYGVHKTFPLTDYFELPEGKDEMDLEGLAYSDHYLYFTGSHNLKRDTPEREDPHQDQIEAFYDIELDENRFIFGRVPCLPDETGHYHLQKKAFHPATGEKLSAKLLKHKNGKDEIAKFLKKDELFKIFMKVPCKENGFDIEGLEVDGDRIFLGLRGPVFSGFACIIEIQFRETKNWLKLKKIGHQGQKFRKHFFDFMGMGIRELAIKEGDLLALAGPSMDCDGTISLWRLKGGVPDKISTVNHQPERLYNITDGSEREPGKDKAEGITILENGDYFIVFDEPESRRLSDPCNITCDVYQKVK
jgi:hypothetical protein